jgi:hypothetical protein
MPPLGRVIPDASSKPKPGQEREYNDWYTNVHMPQVLAVDGFKKAQRYRLARNLSAGEVQPYIALYEIETADLDALIEESAGRMRTERMTLCAAFDQDSVIAAFYEEFGPAQHP